MTDAELDVLEHDGIKAYARPNSSDQITFKDNIVQRLVEKHLTVSEDENWLDCGGYIGTFSLHVLHRGGRVAGIEADPGNAKLYRQNLKLNGYGKKTFLLEKAVVFQPKGPTVEFHRANAAQGYHNAAANTLFNRWKRPHDVIEVPTVSFDDAVAWAKKQLPNGPWNLKLDIEGAELDILESADLSMFQQIYFEYHYQADEKVARAKRIFKRLRDVGFEVKHPALIKTAKPDHWRERTFLGWASRP